VNTRHVLRNTILQKIGFLRAVSAGPELAASAGIAMRVGVSLGKVVAGLRGLASRPSQSLAGSRFFNASIWPK
jgi:hypothetical protein